RVDLPIDNQRRQVAGAELVQHQPALGIGGGLRRASGDQGRRIETDIDWAFPVPCQAPSAVTEGDGDLGGEHDRRGTQKITGDLPRMVGTDRAEVEPTFIRPEQWRVWREQDLTHGVRIAVMQPARHTVPEGSQMLRIAAADVLPCAEILRLSEDDKEIVVG